MGHGKGWVALLAAHCPIAFPFLPRHATSQHSAPGTRVMVTGFSASAAGPEQHSRFPWPRHADNHGDDALARLLIVG